LARKHADVQPALQLRQVPQLMLNGTDTRSPTLTRFTPGPTSSITPMFSCPRTMPASSGARPSKGCKSEPQMLAVVIRMIASSGCSIFGSGTSSTAMSNGPLYTTAFMALPLLSMG
jgi:hypothetical protein